MDASLALTPLLTALHSLSYLSLSSLASGLFIYLRNYSTDFSDISASCRTVIPPVTGFPVLDSYLCFAIPFFQRAVMTPEGRFVTMMALTSALVLKYFMAIEAGRQGVSGITRFAGFFGFLGHLIGLGVVANVFFVPALLSSEARVVKELESLSTRVPTATSLGGSVSAPLRPSETDPTSLPSTSAPVSPTASTSAAATVPSWWHFRGVTMSHAKLCAGLTLAMSILISAMLNSPPISPAFVVLNCVFLFYPLAYLALNFIHLPNTVGTLPLGILAPPENARMTRLAYFVLAGFCAATYYEYLFELLAHAKVLSPQAPLTWSDWVLAVPRGWQLVNFSTEPVVRYLILDAIGIWLAPMIIFISEGADVYEVLGIAAKSMLLSPGGALALKMADREDKITGLKAFYGGGQQQKTKLKMG